MSRIRGWAAWAMLLLLSASGCGGNSGQSQQRLNAGGSTFINPLMSTWTSEYDKAKGVQINYQSIGSGGGIQQMTVKTFDFGCTDGPMNDEQLRKARETGGEVAHIPLILGAVVPAYNLKEVQEPLRFTGPVLADIYLGKIKKWNDRALQELNPDAKLPDLDILVVHRSDGSGTTYIWVDYLSQVSPEWKQRVGVGTSVNWPCGIGQKGNEAVARQVKQSSGSIGYIELAYALEAKISFGSVRNREKVDVQASLESVTAAAQAALRDIPEDLRYSLTNKPGKDSYPISGTTWAVLYEQQPAGKGQQIVDFIRWATHEGQQSALAQHYAILPPELVQRLDKKLAQIRVGQ